MAMKFASTIALLPVVLMFGGLPVSVSAVFIEKAGKSCCDDCHKGASQKANNCSTPDCPIFIFISKKIFDSTLRCRIYIYTWEDVLNGILNDRPVG